MAGIKKGDRGARVHYFGNSARFVVTVPAALFEKELAYLDACSSEQGKGGREVMRGLSLLLDQESQTLHKLKEIKDMLQQVFDSGLQVDTSQQLESALDGLADLDCQEFME